MLLSCAKADAAWAHSWQDAFGTLDPFAKRSPYVPGEHDFLNTIGALHQKLSPAQNLPQRLYPNELLQPIYAMNKPQNAAWGKDTLRPGQENADLSRLSAFGFWRLANQNYTFFDPQLNHSFPIDQWLIRYVPHYQFIHAIDDAADELKLRTRELRRAVQVITTDPSCAFSLDKCQAALRPALASFHQAWMRYTASHEILTEAYQVWSQGDFYRARYEFEAKTPRLTLKTIGSPTHIAACHQATVTDTHCFQTFTSFFQTHAPRTHTAHLLQLTHRPRA